ncbi:hypothetical protein TRIATDRAFT_315765 [Trichoderma atroviride IMI 206040]|uniref:RNase MRP protein 1 RNA binding domain-containing protein n=1 Tax=Hypocrea atroviridis (strain ATCC 20476 / IMI 206040) TaxID=452589 RepID=G9NKV3_HYPAI|nr:uncharacterized protein TRIATDRAFT_315765 [Trichoderma atroviride IMI 206040]EHK48524.1 hypothetical protein TRIATDRAFT_315765 [Trichoderma atroviride IMI 206040]
MASSSPLTAAPFTPLLPILNAFNHRHHNQHRLAHWWPVFRSLRRTIRNLIDDLSPPTSLSSRPGPRREAVPPRAIWLNKHFIPRAYVAFSQLAADNQHAPLGLLLLAILARIHTALSPLSVDTSSTKPQPKTNRSNDLTNQDKGVAIARQELPLTKATPSATSIEGTVSSEQQQQGSKIDREANTSSSSISKEKKKKKKGKGDALSSLFGSLA